MNEFVSMWERYPVQGWFIFLCLLALAFRFAGKRR